MIFESLTNEQIKELFVIVFCIAPILVSAVAYCIFEMIEKRENRKGVKK